MDQVVNGIEACILSGRYRVGDILPTTRDMAAVLGVSHIVTRGAIRRLAQEGLVSPKPGIGCMVLGCGGRLWKGRILLVTRGAGVGYYESVLAAELRERLLKAGWILVLATVAVANDGKADVSELELQLGNPIDLAIVLFENRAADRALARSGVPFVKLESETRRLPRGCVGSVHYDRQHGAPAFAADCVRRGIRHVEEVGCEPFCDTGDALAAVGIRFSSWQIPVPPPSAPAPESFAISARDAFLEYLGDARRRLPDAFYFSDDYVCRGALAAFAKVGVCVPRDVRIATWVNRGNAPVAACSLACLELDCRADAERVCSYVLSRLERRDEAAPVLGTRYITGESMGDSPAVDLTEDISTNVLPRCVRERAER